MRRKGWMFGLLASVGLHLVLVAAALFYMTRSESFSSAPSPSTNPGGTNLDADQQPAPTVAQQLWKQTITGIDRMTSQQQMTTLDDNLQKLKGVPPGSVEEISGLVEKFHRAKPDRALAPDAEATGQFNADTALLYDIAKIEKDGQSVYEYTLMDGEGRTLKTLIAENQMSEPDLRAYRIFEMARQNPALRRLVQTAIRVADTKVESRKQD